MPQLQVSERDQMKLLDESYKNTTPTIFRKLGLFSPRAMSQIKHKKIDKCLDMNNYISFLDQIRIDTSKKHSKDQPVFKESLS